MVVLSSYCSAVFQLCYFSVVFFCGPYVVVILRGTSLRQWSWGSPLWDLSGGKVVTSVVMLLSGVLVWYFLVIIRCGTF